MKYCYKCKEEKELSNFYKNKSKKEGLKDECIECTKTLVKINGKYFKEYLEDWRKNNPNYSTIAHRKWRETNLAKHNCNSAKYRASKLQATPKWLTEDQKLQIQQFYIDAEYLTILTKENIVVDHIMPLQGENSCGLHVPWNLQLLTQLENTKKHNRIAEK